MLLTLVACSDKEVPIEAPLTRPVKTFVVEGGVADAVRTFPGRVDASQRAELSFRVPGRLQKILVKEGDMVEQGQILARLDPADYRLVYEDRKATFDNAQSNFKRGKELVAEGNISRMDFDRMEANFRSASAALSQAEKDLEYTVLESPFSGRVAQRKAENFEEVQAKQTIFSLQNTSQLDIIIDVPESVIRMVRSLGEEHHSVATDERVAVTRAYAEFEGRPGERFPLKPKEIATKANQQTQTFRATFTMASPAKFTVLPGMTATVVLDLSQLIDDDSILKRVPVRAVQGDSSLKPRVWVLDPESMTVSAREVTIGRMSGAMVEVTDGLAGGEEIVSVGAPYLAEGMKVSRMAVTEQAVPRAGDPQ
ncbi:MAG: efflux RND transporter periplasmic adaptor subunit [Halioglobus sp.]|nr:efflux RND transporter periplasmic adaptor subunit [Halioglobus sp.]